MRTAIMPELNGMPALRDVPAPPSAPGAKIIEVIAAGLQPTDVMRSRGFRTSEFPYVIGGEGVGRLEDGSRIYFGHSVPPSGALAEWTLVPEEEIWPLPDDVATDQAIALGIAGTGALIPLDQARIQTGERVLILGATGPLGQVALYLSRLLGAGTVVAAARTRSALDRLKTRGLADEIVQLGQGDDEAALKAACRDGYDVVLDVVYGPPAEAAMRATAPGARMMSIGVQAGMNMSLSLGELVMRSHHGVSTGHRPAAERKAVYERLLNYAREGDWAIDTISFGLEQAEDAWQAQLGSPAGKIVVTTGN